MIRHGGKPALWHSLGDRCTVRVHLPVHATVYRRACGCVPLLQEHTLCLLLLLVLLVLDYNTDVYYGTHRPLNSDFFDSTPCLTNASLHHRSSTSSSFL